MIDRSVVRGSLRAWILASRPPTLGAAVAPVVVGAACAHALGGLRPGPTLAALVGAIWIQIGTNFANDVFDYELGADTGARLGPTRAVQAGLLTPAAMRRGMVVAFALAALCGIYLTWVAGWPVVIIGLASIAAGIAYTTGPFPLGYHGLGELFVLIFFGFVAVCGTVFVNLGRVPELAWWAAVPPGTLATAILVVNNIRDRRTDAEAGKRTLAVRLGHRAAVGEYLALVIVAYAVPAALMLRGILGPWGLLPFLTAPLAVVASRRLIVRTGTALNPVLVATARLLLVFGAALAAALVLGTAHLRVARANDAGGGAYYPSCLQSDSGVERIEVCPCLPGHGQGQGVVVAEGGGISGHPHRPDELPQALPLPPLPDVSGSSRTHGVDSTSARPHGTKSPVLLRISPLKGTEDWALVPFRGLILSSTGLLVPCGVAGTAECSVSESFPLRVSQYFRTVVVGGAPRAG